MHSILIFELAASKLGPGNRRYKQAAVAHARVTAARVLSHARTPAGVHARVKATMGVIALPTIVQATGANR